MRSMDYRQGNSDHTLFMRYVDGKASIFLVYVNDMIVTGHYEKEIVKMKQCL